MSFILLGILNAQAEAAGGATYELLETTILTSSASSVSFTGLGAYTDYKHLQLRTVVRSNKTSTQSEEVTVNSDTGANYARHTLEGNGSSVLSAGQANQNFVSISGGLPGTDSDSGAFQAVVMDILDPFDTSKNTTFRISHGTKTNIISNIRLSSGVYLNTNAISSVTFTTQVNDYIAGSRFSLYGIKAA